MFLEFKFPIPVVTELGDGYAIYIRDGGTLENDIWTIVLKDSGKVAHFRTNQIKIYSNNTFDIIKEYSNNNKQN